MPSTTSLSRPRIVIVGAVTTAWDAAHAVVATMGDRFVLLRPKTNTGRKRAGLGAIRHAEVAGQSGSGWGVGGLRGRIAALPGSLIAAEEE